MAPRRFAALILAIGVLAAAPVSAQPQNARERARPDYDTGLDQMQREAFEAAVRSFTSAVNTDPSFDMAYYMLGRAHMSLKNYASAVGALTECRNLHLADSSRIFADRQEGSRLRRERVQEILRFIGELERQPQTVRVQEQIRQFRERIRQIEDLDRNAGLTPDQAVPAFVSLALGSAHFRAGNLAEAETAYKATVAADPKIGEAHNNLAVVYMETGRYDQALKALNAAEKTGLRVNPELKQEIQRRKKT